MNLYRVDEMSPSIATTPGVSWAESMSNNEPYNGPPRNIQPIDEVRFDEKLRPKNYEMSGTHPGSRILILDVHIIDSTGREPYHGDVLIEGELPRKTSLVSTYWARLILIVFSRRAICRCGQRSKQK